MRARLGCGRRLAFFRRFLFTAPRAPEDASSPRLRPPIGFSSRRFLVTGALDRGCELASAAAAVWLFSEGFCSLRLGHQKMRARLGCGRRLAFLPDGFWSLARWTGDASSPRLRPPFGFFQKVFVHCA